MYLDVDLIIFLQAEILNVIRKKDHDQLISLTISAVPINRLSQALVS